MKTTSIKIKKLHVLPQSIVDADVERYGAGAKDVVFNVSVEFSMVKSDESAQEVIDVHCPILKPSAEFIPFADLKESDVVKWVVSTLGQEKIKAIFDKLETTIDERVATRLSESLPWQQHA